MRKIGVTAAEMLQMREDGLSNHDIAKALDISYATVRNYIGKQGGRMEGLAAFKDKPTKKAAPEEPVVESFPVYEPVPCEETYKVAGERIYIDQETRTVTIRDVGLSFDDIPDIVQFLAWAMRTRMKGEDERGEDQREAEGRTL